ncbi:DUF6252 family protein [Pedobacter sp. Du54]|uniref:DUF6252 family protein n=1 Tax=Pedobacter anseongensis TaxID=3133439 RepID=UPI00309BE4FC
MNTFKKLFFSCMILFSVAACKKDDDGGDGGTAADGIMQAKIGGTSWMSAKISTSAQYVSIGKSLNLLGTDASGKAINIMINNYDGSTGTWQIPNSIGLIGVVSSYTEVNLGGSSKTWAAPYSNSGVIGEVKISEFSKTGNVAGTFKFKARNQNDNADFKDITEGSFNIKVSSF